MKLTEIECKTDLEVTELCIEVESRLESLKNSTPDWNVFRDACIKLGPANVTTLMVLFLRNKPEGFLSVD